MSSGKRGVASLPGSKPAVDEAKIVALKREGLSNVAIAQRFGLSSERIGQILKPHGFGRTRRPQP